MADFHEVQFPTDIAFESAGGPEFSTEVTEMAGGTEARNQNWSRPRERWDVAYGINTVQKLQALLEFFYVRRGRAIGFRFENPDDKLGTAEPLGTADGNETQFQLVKRYSDVGGNFDRKISKPVAGTTTVYLDGALQSSGWTINTTTGLITFTAPPAAGKVVTASFSFDIPVRFDTDYCPVRLSTYQARAAQVPIIELKL